MSELTLLVLRLAFLAVLWAFVFAVIYALRSDLFGQRVRKQAADAAGAPFSAATPRTAPTAAREPDLAAIPARAAPAAPAAPGRAVAGSLLAKRLVITGGPKAGLELDLPAEQLTIGRSPDSGLVIRDDYTSTHHARLMLWNDSWVLQDLDSTNGTYLDGSRVAVPTPVPMNATIKIGMTSFELRR